MIITLAVSGYRSIRNLALPLNQLTIIPGAYGARKSSLYRSLRLLSDVLQGRAIGSLASEGGLPSTLWTGPEQFSRGMRSDNVTITGTVRDAPARKQQIGTRTPSLCSENLDRLSSSASGATFGMYKLVPENQKK